MSGAHSGDGHGHGHPHEHGHGHGPGHGPADVERDALGNPVDLAHYLERLETKERAAWQRPDDVVAALGLREGDVACDVGAGPGYFTMRLSRAVGASGRVHAIEAAPRMAEVLTARLAEAASSNVQITVATDGKGLPPEPVDRILMVNAYHHFHDGVAYLQALATKLRPGGAIVNVDFHGGELPMGPPPDHKVSRERFLEDVRAAGLVVAREETFLEFQYLVFVRPA